jgi:RNA-directed DNA polymerase
LFLELHPKKIYFQHFSKGVKFLGTVIKPHRIYVQNRIKGNFYKEIKRWNNLIVRAEYKMDKKDTGKFLAIMNSYLGLMKHYSTYRLRRKMLSRGFSPEFWDHFRVTEKYDKISIIKKL